ncbi:MAG: 3' terminal RNA ribose 2'-O-methyltransferase Hen1 [Aquisalinus sp.]|nr:3' terminal RNA ribose 2'-O-methyltransferase Hen1 [Aquisalinus sp.]
MLLKPAIATGLYPQKTQKEYNVYLSISTTHQPATDLGFLLHKNPSNVHETSLSFGRAVIFYPEATEKKCTASLMLDIDPIDLVRGRKGREGESLLDHYVNDRPYAASSFLSVALARSYREALNGTSKQRQELADTEIPLEATLSPLPCRGREELACRLFEPLGYKLQLESVLLDDNYPEWGKSAYKTLKLKSICKLSDLLTHLYVLIPVLDNQKHYWIGSDEVDKLIEKGGQWLEEHPERDLIATRYLKRGFSARATKKILDERFGITDEPEENPDEEEEKLEKPIRLNDLRYEVVTDTLLKENVRKVVDLGCGEGKLLKRLIQERQFERIVGVEVSPISLERAERRLNLDNMSPTQRDRIDILHGSLVYEDNRLEGFDALTLIEVIEHVDEERLDALERVIFGQAAPPRVLVSTPNREFNVTFENMTPGMLRHVDHRFEWTRAEFQDWANGVCERHGYKVSMIGIGEVHEEYGAPTQMAVFKR